ncbi:hypothetical protein [Paenibacillus popilliae]|nr:hypothetical protein [Paenibacillus popilliae]
MLEKPTVEEIVRKLKSVLQGHLSREEVSNWAGYWIRKFRDEFNLNEEDLLIWKYLDVVLGIDLKDTPTEYFHIDEDILDWIKIFEEQQLNP